MGRKKAGVIYSALTAVVYLWIVVAVIKGLMPVLSLIALLTIPFAIKAIQCTLRYGEKTGELVLAMRNNVLVVLLTQLFLGLGYILAGIL
jgi:1,4-dihydroxy-2-naphthoate octaprenyltransferase